MTTPPPLILLVGMHRSGTSLLGSLLPALGIPLPGPLLGGDRHNPEGYYERADITDLQENLLIHLGHWWPSQSGALPLPLDWQEHPRVEDGARRLGRLLDDEMERQAGPWAIKDPRTSLLLPLWQRLAAERSLPLRLILCVRDPAEVATSLVERDRKAAGMTAWRAQQLWWRHNTQVLLDGQDLPLMVVPYGGWFDAPQDGAERLRRLARFCGRPDPADADLEQALRKIRPEHRRSRRGRLRRWPIHPRARRLERRLLALAQHDAERGPLVDDLTLAPRTLALPLARWRHRGGPAEPTTPLDPGSHPWAPAALALQGGHHGAARLQLQHWQQRGAPSALDLSRIAAAPERFFLQSRLEGPALAAPDAIRLFAGAAGWRDWPPHAWLQHIPLPLDPERGVLLTADEQTVAPPATTLGLHLLPVAVAAERGWLPRLASLGRVFDPDPGRVRLLRRLGIAAVPLATDGPTNGWLEGPQDLPRIAERLGLADPAALSPIPGGVLCLGSGGAGWERSLRPPFWCLPAFDRLRRDDPEDARLVAAWLNRAQRAGLQLVRIDPGDEEERLDGFQALERPVAAAPDWLPAQTFRAPLDLEALEEELRWHRAGSPPPEACVTPAPEVATLFEHGEGPAAAAICVSLHNYADRIIEALDSARRQSFEDLELIVVDDASTDDGDRLVESWMREHAPRFRRCLLLRHRCNGGLAASRNRAFASTTAPWAFVLDADNQLLPAALDLVLGVARHAPGSTAVVHPLVELRGESREPGQPALLHPMSWQREHFVHSNYIDAMALVRVSAWRAVGGYVHIPGGWEDYDFWCLLIEAGFHGVQCPQRLAVYNQHGGSMVATSSNRRIRRISRVLQARHPWLAPPWARPGW